MGLGVTSPARNGWPCHQVQKQLTDWSAVFDGCVLLAHCDFSFVCCRNILTYHVLPLTTDPLIVITNTALDLRCIEWGIESNSVLIKHCSVETVLVVVIVDSVSWSCWCVRRRRTRTTPNCLWTVWKRWSRRVYLAVMIWTYHTPATQEPWVPSRPTSTCRRRCRVSALAVYTRRPTAALVTPALPWWPDPTTTSARLRCMVVTGRHPTRRNTAAAAWNVMQPAAVAVEVGQTSRTHSSDLFHSLSAYVWRTTNFWVAEAQLCSWNVQTISNSADKTVNEKAIYDLCKQDSEALNTTQIKNTPKQMHTCCMLTYTDETDPLV